MGIRGLTSFIERLSFLEKYELYGTELVIDGDSISRQLYAIHSTYQNAILSDYDVFEDYVDSFFEMLDSCQIIPYVVFEGVRNQQSKLKKESSRLQSVAEITNHFWNGDDVYFPLFMRDVFENVLKKWKVKTVRCDFKSYSAIVSIAKSLSCPVLTYDSNYFICPEITIIPFRTLCTSGNKPYPRVCRHILKDKSVIKYIPCERFDVNRFLEYLNLSAVKLPLLAVMLDANHSEYPNYQCLWSVIPKFQERIVKVASWISPRSIETAVNDILSLAESSLSEKKLQQKLESYRCLKSKYLANFEICSNQDELPENERDLETDCLVSEIPDIFLENYRNCRYSPYLMDIYIHNQYYGLKTQVENFSCPHSQVWSEKIVSAIHKILTNSNTNLSCLMREGDCIILKEISLCNVNVPSFTDIEDMDVESKKSVILRILELDLQKDALQEFPESWQLFVITVLYLQSLSSLTLPLCYSLVMCKTILSYKDCKNYRLFCSYDDTFYNARLKQPSSVSSLQRNMTGCTTQILHEMQNFVKYFQIKDDVRISFDINLLHGMSQFQSCLLHIKVLNDLLNMPYPNVFISDTFNGTFIYNFSLILEQSPNIDDFVKISLQQESPKIIFDFQTILAKIGKISDIFN